MKLRIPDYLILILLSAVFLAVHINRIEFPPQCNVEEVYYAPAAVTYGIHDKIDPNISHPPLAKMLMFLFIRIFGDNSIGWRAGSLIFGLFSVILTYLFGLLLFKSRAAAVWAGFIISFDFLHFVQSRVATIDIYLLFFILLGLYFAYLHSGDDSADNPVLHKWSILAAISFGLGICCKLSGFAGVLTALVFYAVMLIKRKRFSFKNLAALFGIYTGTAAVLFVLVHIPLFIKGAPLSHMFYQWIFYHHYQEQFRQINQTSMWQWLIAQHPFWYYSKTDYQNLRMTVIGAMGGFLLWWGFWIFFIRAFYLAVKTRSSSYIMLIIGYLGLFLFWLSSFHISSGSFYFKGGFIWYMLPCVPFMALTVGEMAGYIWNFSIPGKICALVYGAGTIYFFNWFYPLLAGVTLPVSGIMERFGASFTDIVLIAAILNLQMFLPPVISKFVEMDEKKEETGQKIT